MSMETYSTSTETSTSTSTETSTSTLSAPDACPIPSLPLHRLSISSPPPTDAEFPLFNDISTSTSPSTSPSTSISSWTSSPYQPISPVLTPDPHVQEIHMSSHSRLHESHSSPHLHDHVHSSSFHQSIRPISISHPPPPPPPLNTDITPIPSPHLSTSSLSSPHLSISSTSSPTPICFTLTRKRSHDIVHSPIPKRMRCEEEYGLITSSSSYGATNPMYNPSSRAKQYIRSPHIMSPSIHHSPCLSPSSPSSPRPSSPAPTMTLPSHRILLIDTISSSRLITYTHLSQMGWNVDVTHTWEMGYDLWQQHHYRTVLCDMGESEQILMEPDHDEDQHLPRINLDYETDGMRSLTRFINMIRTYDDQHKQERHTIILGVTSHLTSLQQQHCMNMGMDGCMAKGLDMGQTLVDTLESVWTKRLHGTPTLVPTCTSSSRGTPTPLVLNSSSSRRPSLSNISSPHTPTSIFASGQLQS